MADFLKDIIIDGQLQTNERIYTLGGIRITGGIYDQNNSIGTAGQLLTSDGTNVEWVNTSQILGTQSNVTYYDVKNTTGATISKGKVVMAVGTDGNSGHILIDEMVADGSVEPRYILGVLNEDIAHGTTGQAIYLGQIKQLNTTGQNGETWSDGTVLWCDPNSPGDLTQTEPNGPNLKIPVAIVLNAATNGKIQVRATYNEGIHDLHDTKIVNQVDGDILVWDNTTGVWFNDSTLNVDQGVGVDITGNLDVSGVLRTDEVRTLSAQQLVLNAGESHAYATGQTGEYVYINAEKGLFIASSPDNWATAWANRTTGVMGTLGNSDGKLRLGSNSADNILLIRGGSTKAEITSTGIDVTGDLTVSNSTVAQLYLDSATGNDSAIYHRENSVQVAKTGYDTSEDVWAVVAGGGAFSTAQLKVDTNGVDITGNLDVSGTGTFNLSSNGTYFIGGTNSLRQLSITSGDNISSHALHTFNIASSNGKYEFQVNGSNVLDLDSAEANITGNLDVSGGVSVGDGGTTAKLEVGASTGEVFRADANFGAYRIVANQTDVLLQGTTIDVNGNLDVSGSGTFGDDISVGLDTATGDGKKIHIHDSVNAFSTLHLTNSVTGSAITDGFNITTSNLDVNIRNREAGNIIFQTGADTNQDFVLTPTGSTFLNLLTANGKGVFGQNLSNTTTVHSTPSVTLQGVNVATTGTSVRYGNYGSLLFEASSNFTASARPYLVTNAYKARMFGIIAGVDANTNPSLGINGEIDSGVEHFSINYTGDVYIPNGNLDVSGTGTFDGLLTANGGITSNGQLVVNSGTANTGLTMVSTDRYSQIRFTDDTNSGEIQYDGAADRFNILASTNITGNLDVSGDVTAQGDTVTLLNENSGNKNINIRKRFDGSSYINWIRSSNTDAYIGVDETENLQIGYASSGLNRDLIFTSNNSEVIRFDRQGYVGIGTTSPQGPLDVYVASGNANAYIRSNTDNAYLHIDSGLDGVSKEESGIIFSDNGSAHWAIYKDSGNDFSIYDYTGGYKAFEILDNGRMDLMPGAAKDVTLVTGGGYVGIGTTTPSEKLDVSGNIKLTETAATVDTDKFAVLDSGVLKYRTGAEVLSDIGAAPSSHTHSQYLLNNAFDEGVGLYLTAGSYNAGTDTATTPLVIDEGDFIYTKDGSYLRRLIGKTTGDEIQIGQSGTSLIDTINFLPGTGGNSAVKVNGNTVWNAGNDGSGSGLDADLLDGQHASDFADASHNHDAAYVNVSGDTMTGALNMGTANIIFQGTDPGDLVWNNGSGSEIHRLWAGTNTLNYRTNAGTTYELWHSGNDGSGSGLDADLLDGNHASAFATASHTHDDRYYTESEIQTFFNRGYITAQTANNLPVGWYTIATNTGDRALGEFQIWDVASSRHQSVLFNASHHFGVDSSNDITVLANSRFNTDVFRYIRIKEGGTYDGAALQVYIDNSSNAVRVAITGANAQESGWVLKDWIADATNPGDVDNYSSFTEACKIDLDNTRDGGIATTGNIFSGGASTQYRNLTTADEGSGNGLDADTLDGQHASAFLTSYTETDTLDSVADRGRTTNQQLISTNSSGFRVDSGSYARIEIDSNNNWSYIRLQDNATTSWDIASYNGGNLELRPGGSSSNRTYFDSSGNSFSEGSKRAPIFYDSNDTGYYGDFAGNSRYNTAQGNHLGLGVEALTSGGYRLNMGGHIDMNANNINYVSQLHFNDNVRFYDDGNDSYLNFKYGDANFGGIRFRRGDNAQKGYLFASNDGFGLLDSDGDWAVRTQTGTNPLELRCNGELQFEVYPSYTKSLTSSRAPIFYDSDNTGYYVNPASQSHMSTLTLQGNRIGFVNSSFDAEIRVSDGNPNGAGAEFVFYGDTIAGNAQLTSKVGNFTSQVRTPILYDSNNTSYYLDPSNTGISMKVAGDVGIGTTSPNAKLDVNGHANASNGYSTNNTSRKYFWRTDNTFNSGTIWKKIGTYNSSGQSSRIMITITGTVSYGGGTKPGKTTILAQVNNNNLLEGTFWAEGMSSQYGNVGFISNSATSHDIYYQVGSYAEYAYEAIISDGTFTVDSTTVSTPTFTRTATREWNVNQNLIVNSSGWVGIGLTSPRAKFHAANGTLTTWTPTSGTTGIFESTASSRSFVQIVSANEGELWFSDAAAQGRGRIRYQHTDDSLRVWVNGSEKMSIGSGGSATFTGSVTATNFILSSDERVKENIENLTPNKLNVNWKTFNMKSEDEDNSKRYGVIAQELEEEHPEFVNTDDEGFKSVKYIDLLVAKIAELEARLEKLEK